MNQKVDNEPLLAAVFAEAEPANFRDALFGETLRRVHRRRRWRQTRRLAGIFVVLGLLGIFVWQKNLPQRTPAPMTAAKTAGRSYTRVRTQPLPARETITTQPLAPGRFVASMAAVDVVQTGRGNYRLINDNELLALLTSHPAALVRTGPHSEQLIFANPEDEKGFPLN